MRILSIILFVFSFEVSVALLSTIICDFRDGNTSCCPASPSEVIIADTMTAIPSEAFSDCINLLSVVIPNSVIQISARAFFGCSFLTSVTLPNSLTVIEESAFAECFYLRSIDLPGSLSYIGERAFYNSGLRDIVIPKGVTTLSARSFEYCSELTGVILPSTLIVIEEGVFSGCSGLTSIVLPNSVTTSAALPELTSNHYYADVNTADTYDSDEFHFSLLTCPYYPDNQLMAYSSKQDGSSPACTVSVPGQCEHPHILAITCFEEVLNLTLCLSAPSSTCTVASQCDITVVYESADSLYTRDILVRLPSSLDRYNTVTIYTADETAPYKVNNKFPLDKYGFVYYTATQPMTQIYFDRGCHVLSRRDGMASVLEYCSPSDTPMTYTDVSGASTVNSPPDTVGDGASRYSPLISICSILLVLLVLGYIVYVLTLGLVKGRAAYEFKWRQQLSSCNPSSTSEPFLGTDMRCTDESDSHENLTV